MFENHFPMCFFEGGDLKVQLYWSLKGVNIGMTLLLEMEIKKVWSVNCLLSWRTMWRRYHLMSVLSFPAYQYLLHYKLSIPKFLPAPILPMSARSIQKNSSSFWYSLSPTASSASTRNSINKYRVQPWVHLSPLSLQISTWNTLNP